jgi:replicative DNA helicase
LGAAMLDKDALYDVMEEVRFRTFITKSQRNIRSDNRAFQKEFTVDFLTVAEELKKKIS